MDWNLMWDAIGGIAGVLAVLLTIFLEWPRFKMRLVESAGIFRTILLGSAIVCGVVGCALLGIHASRFMRNFFATGEVGETNLGDLTQGRVGILLLFITMGISSFDMAFEERHKKNSPVLVLLLVLGCIFFILAGHLLYLLVVGE